MYMNLCKSNASSATGTRNRYPDVAPISGICAICLDGCHGPCEIGRSSLRGRELIYPQPFGEVTSGAIKDYPVDYTHLSIQGTCVGAVGVAADPDEATFPAVDVSTEFGSGPEKIKLKIPVFTGALGSTDIARNNWEHLAAGAGIAGIAIVCGENVVGMDPNAVIENGRAKKSPDMERRIKTFLDWQDGEYGAIIVQYNVEDGRLGVPEMAIELGATCIELKWGQGAKDIGGEVKLPSLERALQLKGRGYIVLPDPEDPWVQEAFQQGTIKEFERHSRLGMVDEDEFSAEVERLRGLGARYVTLKTGAYRAADMARALRFASNAKIDLLTIDGAGGGTGMSPWRMMNEWGVPTIYLQAMAYNMAQRLEQQGCFVPDMAMAGGFSMEDHLFKVLALGAPYFKAVCMGRATMIPGMLGKNIQKWLDEGDLPRGIAELGDTPEQIFVNAVTMRHRFEDNGREPMLGALAMDNYMDRLKVGLSQFMAGARKFALEHITRDDLISLTRECADVTGIPYVMEHDEEEVDKLLTME